MEDALRVVRAVRYGRLQEVLILVLMEDALRGERMNFSQKDIDVLILVLMEDALRVLWGKSLQYL